MSLVAYAIRTCLWRALLGRTLAGDRVHDSAVTELSELLDSDPRPFIIVSTDDDEGEVSGNDYLTIGERKLDVVIEIAVGSIENVGTAAEPNYAIRLASSDDGFETTVDFLGRQVLRVLQAGEGVFADLFRAFTPGRKRIMRRRGAGTNPRFAARQIVLTCDPLHEPAFGEAPEAEWADLVAAMRADPVLTIQADLLAAEIVGDALPEWEQLRARLGVTRAGLRAVGLGGYLPGEAPAVFEQAEIAMEHGDLTASVGDEP